MASTPKRTATPGSRPSTPGSEGGWVTDYDDSDPNMSPTAFQSPPMGRLPLRHSGPGLRRAATLGTGGSSALAARKRGQEKAAAAASSLAAGPLGQLIGSGDVDALRSLLGLDAGQNREQLSQSVVKIFCTMQEASYIHPWQTTGIGQGSGSGVVIDKRRILTAAHVVANQTFLQVQRTQVDDPRRRVAYVQAVCHQGDLAVLRLRNPEEEDEFFDGLDAVELADMPRIRDRVHVAGYPVGGEELSITEGVVSRIEGQPFAHSHALLLALTVDAAINSGNSGGATFSDDGKLIGIAFQGLIGADGIGHVIPPPVIRQFLDTIADEGKLPEGTIVTPFPSMGVSFQELTNPRMRAHLRMEDAQSGVLINEVAHRGSADGVVRAGDVLMSVGGHRVSNQGTVAYNKLRLDLPTVWSSFRCGETVAVQLWRDGALVEETVKMRVFAPLVRPVEYDVLPQYFVFCGLVVQPLSLNLILQIFGQSEGTPPELVYLLEQGKPSSERLEVVVATQILSDEVNQGYSEVVPAVISSINGEVVRDLQHMVDLIETKNDNASDIVLRTSRSEMILLPGAGTDTAKEANARILTNYRIPGDRRLGDSASIAAAAAAAAAAAVQ